jgi:hypothetical protein
VSAQERLKILREAKPDTWIAFSTDENRQVAARGTFGNAAKKAEESGERDPIFKYIPSRWEPTLLQDA